jgi:hypothetical protein
VERDPLRGVAKRPFFVVRCDRNKKGGPQAAFPLRGFSPTG